MSHKTVHSPPEGSDDSRAAPPVGVLATEVRRRRVTLELRQSDLAELAGCSIRFVHALEHGKQSLQLDKLLDVLDVLGLELIARLRSTP